MADKPVLDLTLVPGTKREQMNLARDWLVYGTKPIAVRKEGKLWRVVVLGVDIGGVLKKEQACGAAFQIGYYRLELGQFAHRYIEGSCK